jgi:hypothetical protein
MYAAVASRTEQATVDATWRQWRALKGEGAVGGKRVARAIIDPEALVVASLVVRRKERRLQDLLLWWAGSGARLLSVQRLQTVTKLYPASRLDGGVEWFAAMALQAGDGRWKRLAQGDASDEPTRAGKGPKELDLLDPSTLMLRLRAGFGVGAKADLMTFLIGVGSPVRATGVRATSVRTTGVRTTTSVLAESVGYSRASVSRAVAEMSLARFIDASSDRPPMYSIQMQAWARVLRLWDPEGPMRDGDRAGAASFDVPPWRFWSQVLAFLMECQCWAENAGGETAAKLVQASRARDLVERFGRYLAWNGLELPDARVHTGERYIEPFVRLVEEAVGLVEADAP